MWKSDVHNRLWEEFGERLVSEIPKHIAEKNGLQSLQKFGVYQTEAKINQSRMVH